MNKEEFLRRRSAIKAKSDILWNDINDHAKEEKRVISVLHSAEFILSRLDKTFEQRTSLSKTDISILILATALQLVRIYALPRFQEKYLDENRLDHGDDIIKDMEREEVDEYKRKHKDWVSKKSEKGYRSWQEIAFTIKVPYDATRHSGARFHNRNMHGGQHRVKTLGHDPILGWIFGVANIISDTITICPEYELGEKKIVFRMLSHIALTWVRTSVGRSKSQHGMFSKTALKVLVKTNIDFMRPYSHKDYISHPTNIPN